MSIPIVGGAYPPIGGGSIPPIDTLSCIAYFGLNTKRFLKVLAWMVGCAVSPPGGIRQPDFIALGRTVMYGTRFRRRGVLRPESTAGRRSRRRLLMRPAAYAILAVARLHGRRHLAFDRQARRGQGSRSRRSARAFTVTAGDLAFILKQIKIAERHAARSRQARSGIRQPVRSATRLLPVAGRPGREPDPGPADVLRPAHRRRLVQQPVPGPGDSSRPPTSRSRG